MYKVYENNIMKPGQTYKVDISINNEGEGVRIIFKVDGQTVFNELDTIEAIGSAGYLTMYSHGHDTPSHTTITNFKFTEGPVAAPTTAPTEVQTSVLVETGENDTRNNTGNPETGGLGAIIFALAAAAVVAGTSGVVKRNMIRKRKQ
jgi:hypothetical protein